MHSFLKLINFNWMLITLKYCDGFAIQWHESTTGVHVSSSQTHFPPNSHPIPLGCPSALALSALFHALNLDWGSLSHMVIYMFLCYSLKVSHSCFLTQSPKVCSLYLCLFSVSHIGLLLSSF